MGLVRVLSFLFLSSRRQFLLHLLLCFALPVVRVVLGDFVSLKVRELLQLLLTQQKHLHEVQQPHVLQVKHDVQLLRYLPVCLRNQLVLLAVLEEGEGTEGSVVEVEVGFGVLLHTVLLQFLVQHCQVYQFVSK